MALEESTDGLEELESNGVTAYIDPKLKEMLRTHGTIIVDYMKQGFGGGYVLTVGEKNCQGGCDGC